MMLSGQQLRLPSVIGSGMVLQQNENVNIWGWSKPSAKVSVEAQWLDEPVVVKAGKDGRWTAVLKTPAGGYDQYKMTISDGKSEIALEEILIGEVWLCSGQSNMAWRVNQTLDLKDECKRASELGANVRLYSTGRISAKTPQDDVLEAKWQKCSPSTVETFSAVGYGFGLELQKGIDVPVGLIQAAYGGTFLEGWVSESAITEGDYAASFEKSIRKINKKDGKWSGKESHMWNANICPLLPTRIAGVIWYQGCANVTVNPISYRKTLQGLIESWRSEFKNPQMPFYIAQIAPHTYSDIQGALLRESQAYVTRHVDNCELVVTNDSQEIPGDIHPRYKKNVCHRFALCALGQHYKKDVGTWKSPAFGKVTPSGSNLIVSFKNVPTALTVKGDKIIGFQIGEVGADGKLTYYLADAYIDESGKRIVLSSDKVSSPSEARYCFDESVGNVFSAEGLPLAPFKSDKAVPTVPSARAYLEPASLTPVTFEGAGYAKAVLKDGVSLWSNSKLTLFEGSYPKEFEGFEVLVSETVPDGAKSNGGVIVAQEDGRIYVIARTDKATRKTWYKDWRMIVPSELALRRVVGETEDGFPKFKTVDGLYIHYIDVKKGDRIKIHETDSWAGVIPLASSIEYNE